MNRNTRSVVATVLGLRLISPRRERWLPVLPANRFQRSRQLLESLIEHSEWMRIEKRCTIPIDGRVFVIELDVTGSEVLVVGILVEAEHQVTVRFDPVDAVVFVVNAGWVPESNFQPCGLRDVGITHERRRVDIRDDVPRASLRRTITHVLAPGLIRQPVVNVSEERPLCISIATGKKDHTVREED